MGPSLYNDSLVDMEKYILSPTCPTFLDGSTHKIREQEDIDFTNMSPEEIRKAFKKQSSQPDCQEVIEMVRDNDYGRPLENMWTITEKMRRNMDMDF